MFHQVLRYIGLVVGAILAWPALAENCPTVSSAGMHAVQTGVGAKWDESGMQWYLDYFSAPKPTETAVNKMSFLQASFEDNQLTCYYGWPSLDGRSTDWMTVRLTSSQTVVPKWQGAICQNFSTDKCEFDMKEPAAPVGTAPATPPSGTVNPKAATPQTPPLQDSVKSGQERILK